MQGPKRVCSFCSFTLGPRATVIVFVYCLLLTNCRSESKKLANNDAVRHNNLGVALMDAGVKDPSYFPEAINEFEAALKASSDYRTARINLGIAYYFAGQKDRALVTLTRVLEDEPDELHAHYVLGLIHEGDANYAEAEAHFSRVTQADPSEPNGWFHLGSCFSKQGQFRDAVEPFRRAAGMVPYQRAYRYNLFMSLSRAGYKEEAQAEFENFRKLETSNIRVVDAPTKELAYLKQGKYAEAIPDPINPASHPPVVPHYSPLDTSSGFSFQHNGAGSDADVRRVLSGEPMAQGWFADDNNRRKVIKALGSGASFCDYNNDGRLDLFLVNVDSDHALFEQEADGHFTNVTSKVGIGRKPLLGMACAWGDYDNDGWSDLLITGYGDVRLYHNVHGSFQDETQRTGIAKSITRSKWCLGAAFSDVDHDGDLDLYITSFVELTSGGDKSELRFPNDFPASPNLLLQNNLNGTFTDISKQAKADGGGIKSCNVWFSDVNNDRAIDLVLFDFAGTPSTLLNMKDGSFTVSDTKVMTLPTTRPQLGESHAFGDYNGDGAVDELINKNGQPAVLNRNETRPDNWLTVRLKGYDVPSQLKSNSMAIGTKVEVRAVGSWSEQESHSGNGMQGCDAPELYFDLGKQEQVDFVRAVFPSGVRWTLRDLRANQAVKIEEPLLDVNSCPVLFAWNGTRFTFITDTIGAGVLGELVAPGKYWKPDPDEWLRVTTDELNLSGNGTADFRFVNPLEEVTYLNRVRLIAVDHPATTEVYPSERMVNESENRQPVRAFALANFQPLHEAMDQDGTDVTSALAKIDRRYGGKLVPTPFKGFARNWALTLDLGYLEAPSRTVLLLHSWSYWNSSASIIAADQSDKKLWGPVLDVLGKDYRWHERIKDLGVSAGLPRTIVIDLSSVLKPGEHVVRIRSNRTLYYDQASTAQKSEQVELVEEPIHASVMRAVELPLTIAQLRWLGYPKRLLPDGRLPEVYDYQQIATQADWSTHVGLLTRYGNVLPLLQQTDQQFVVMGNGEEVSLSFDGSHLPELPAGWKRTFLFYSSGYEKTYDLRSPNAQTIDPLPSELFARDPLTDQSSTVLEWNTRPSFIRSNGVRTVLGHDH